jgi:hypothetical protein
MDGSCMDTIHTGIDCACTPDYKRPTGLHCPEEFTGTLMQSSLFNNVSKCMVNKLEDQLAKQLEG